MNAEEERREERKEVEGGDGDGERMVDEGVEGMISCPICTYLNSSSSASCEVCDSPLH